MPVVAAVAVPHPPLIIPHVGRGQEDAIRSTIDSFHKAMSFLAAHKPQTVVIISPHSILYADYFHLSPGKSARGDFGRFGAPGVQIETTYDTDLVRAISAVAEQQGIPAGTEGERDPTLDHATLIPLWFLDQVYPAYYTVRVGLSGLSAKAHYTLGRCIEQASAGKTVAIIASGDLSHRLVEEGPYGYRPEGPRLDEEITQALKTADFNALLSIDETLAEKGAECGLRSFWIMAGAFDGRKVQPDLLSYEGPFGVGYAVATFLPGGPDETRKFAR